MPTASRLSASVGRRLLVSVLDLCTTIFVWVPTMSDAPSEKEIDAALSCWFSQHKNTPAQHRMKRALKAAYAASPLLQEVERRFQAIEAQAEKAVGISPACRKILEIVRAPWSVKENPS